MGQKIEKRLRVSGLASHERQKLQHVFAQNLIEFLRDKIDRDQLLENVSKAIGRKVARRQFDTLLRSLYADQYLRISGRQHSDLADELRRKPGYQNLRIRVSSAISEEHFAEAGAQEFIEQLKEKAQLKIKEKARQKTRDEDRPLLRVGIVSGRTTGTVIRKVMEVDDWPDRFGIDLDALPSVHVFALNACLTTAEHLQNNASILALQLADKINQETGDRTRAKAWGLSAPLFVETRRLRETDTAPQTLEVVQHTEPSRIRANQPDGHSPVTDLDIVLTGVGEAPSVREEGDNTKTSRSIFYALAESFGVDMHALEKEYVVGDLAFTAIQSDGRQVILKRRTAPALPEQARRSNDEEIECMFYSAVRLPVFKAMAADPEKAVILVARGGSKIPAIHASACMGRYVSSLVIDESTANSLLLRPGAMR